MTLKDRLITDHLWRRLVGGSLLWTMEFEFTQTFTMGFELICAEVLIRWNECWHKVGRRVDTLESEREYH